MYNNSDTLLPFTWSCPGNGSQEKSRYAFDLGIQAYDKGWYSDAEFQFLNVDSAGEFAIQAKGCLSEIDSMKSLLAFHETEAASIQEEIRDASDDKNLLIHRDASQKN